MRRLGSITRHEVRRRPGAASERSNGSRNGRSARERKCVMITGGAGFIGSNLADRLLSSGREVIVYDNLSRAGVTANLEWLTRTHGSHLKVEPADVRDSARLLAALRHADQVFHFAAQVAVTTSFEDPREDFEINVGGTLNLLEALRSIAAPPPLIFTSTNKVYGSMADLRLRMNCTRYQPLSHRSGIDESRPLDFHSPYGCSKGAADQYVLDYARSMGLPAAVFRMSCIYGPHQFGNEDQGWIAHFLIRAIDDQPLTIYGDGKQVRDVLFVGDLVDALLLAQHHMNEIAGEAFNIGGGAENTLSLVELLDMLRELHGTVPPITSGEWRAGDQKYYVSDIGKFRMATGWSPRVGVAEGVQRLYRWLMEWRRSDRGERPRLRNSVDGDTVRGQHI